MTGGSKYTSSVFVVVGAAKTHIATALCLGLLPFISFNSPDVLQLAVGTGPHHRGGKPLCAAYRSLSRGASLNIKVENCFAQSQCASGQDIKGENHFAQLIVGNFESIRLPGTVSDAHSRDHCLP
jgi:hypothetical protein